VFSINLQTGAVVAVLQAFGAGFSVAGATAEIEDAGNGWYRLKINGFTSNTATTLRFAPVLGGASRVGVTSNFHYLWGAQLEQKPFCTSYSNFNSQNLLLYSYDFANAAWVTAAGIGVTSNAALAPDGTMTADVYTENTTAAATHYQEQTVSKATTALAYSVSFYAKLVGGTRRLAAVLSDGTSNAAVVFDLVTGTIGMAPFRPTGTTFDVTGATGSMEYVGNGWWRLKFENVISSTLSSIRASLRMDAGSGSTFTQTYTGAVNNIIHIWGAQLEQAAACTPYVPTTSHRLGRAADVASGTADADVTDLVLNKEDGTYYPVDVTAGQEYRLEAA
jgi:hypothetical protein